MSLPTQTEAGIDDPFRFVRRDMNRREFIAKFITASGVLLTRMEAVAEEVTAGGVVIEPAGAEKTIGLVRRDDPFHLAGRQGGADGIARSDDDETADPSGKFGILQGQHGGLKLVLR